VLEHDGPKDPRFSKGKRGKQAELALGKKKGRKREERVRKRAEGKE
jgi:hypothetical protein